MALYNAFIIIITSRVPVEGKSSVCAFSMKYLKTILIIIIISLGQILLPYIANTSRTQACTRTHTLAHPPVVVQVVWLFDGSVHPTMTKLTAPFRRAMNGRSVLHSN